MSDSILTSAAMIANAKVNGPTCNRSWTPP